MVGQGGGTLLWGSLAASPQPFFGAPQQCPGLGESTRSFPQTWAGSMSSTMGRWAWEDAPLWRATEGLPVLCTGLWRQPGRFQEWGGDICFATFLAFVYVYVSSVKIDIFCCFLACFYELGFFFFFYAMLSTLNFSFKSGLLLKWNLI